MSSQNFRLFLHSRLLAARRKWAIFQRGQFNPYRSQPDGTSFSQSKRIDALAEAMRPQLDWSRVEPGDLETWQQMARKRLRSLLRVPDKVAPLQIQSEANLPITAGYERKRFYVRFGPECDAPVDIVRRADLKSDKLDQAPVVICMQGTNSGAHLNLGEVRMPADVYKVANGSALALQAADNGYIAVSFERACFGERRERYLEKSSASPTVDAAFHALAIGETLLGQTVAELEALRLWIGSELAPGAPVYLAGYSAAGTAAIAAAATRPEFSGIAVGGCVGMMRDTILRRGAGGYNDIPDILKWFEFDALFALIAPRPCVVIAGLKDHIWPHSAAEKVVASARSAWVGLSAADSIKLVQAPQGHTYYPELMWPALEQVAAVDGIYRT
jgi:hypothetical protein